MNTLHVSILALSGALVLGGCATGGDPRDPLEPFNRAVYSFNDGVDRTILKPMAEGYRDLTPKPVQTGVRNAFSNLNDLTVFSNSLLQGKLENASSDFMRLAFNSTLGLFGLLDIASEMGLKKHNEDFGQTLGHWGMGSGAYVVLPFLGPSTVRDTAGLVVDAVATDVPYHLEDDGARYGSILLRVISRRADLLEAQKAIETAALDEYEFTRDFYLERREALVYDGTPPLREE